MSESTYRAVILVAISFIVIGGLGYGFWVELDISLVSQGPDWAQYDDVKASVRRPVSAARFMFIGAIAGLIVALFYNWPKGSRRGRIFVALTIVGLIASWVAVTAWAGEQVDRAISDVAARRPAGLPYRCDSLYTTNPDTGLSETTTTLPAGGLIVSAETVAADSSVTIDVATDGFQPDDITIPANRDVEFFVFNTGVWNERFIIDDLGVDLTVPECHLQSVSINAPAGEYVFRSESSDPFRDQEITGLLHVSAEPQEPNALPTAGGSPDVPTEASPNVSIALNAGDIFFDPNALTIPANTNVTVELRNEGAAQHNLTVAGTGIDVDIAPGDSTQVRINLPAGEYAFYCNVPGHREAGMVGTLTVVD